jgi:hypothetical protein
LEALLPSAVAAGPLRRADDLVVTDSPELGLQIDAPLAPFLNLEPQDLTGLVGAASGGSALPPEMAAGDTAPFRVFGEQGAEGLGVALVECCGRRPQLFDHPASIARSGCRLRSVPESRCGDRARVVCEVARLTAEGPPNAVGVSTLRPSITSPKR